MYNKAYNIIDIYKNIQNFIKSLYLIKRYRFII